MQAAYPGDSQNLPSQGPASVTVTQASTTTSVGCASATVIYATPTACTATVTGYSPTGFITWSTSGAGGFSVNPCVLVSGRCSVTYTARSPAVITATYSGDANNTGSSGTFSISLFTVVMPVQFTVANSAPSTQVMTSGCGATPTSILANGGMDAITAYENCSPVVVSLPSASSTRYVGLAGVGQFVLVPCASGTCSLFSATIYYQLFNTYQASPTNPQTWTSTGSIAVGGTALGTSQPSVCTIPVTAGGGQNSCQAWVDYNTQASMGPLSVSPGERWATAQGSFTDVAGGNQHAAAYFRQFLDSFRYSLVASQAPPTTPMLTSTSFGSIGATPLAQSATSLWLDAGAAWSVPQVLTGSGGAERWSTQLASGTVGAGQTVLTIYYQQYYEQFTYSVVGKASGFGIPSITLEQFGAQLTTAQQAWADAGSNYNFTDPLPGSTATARWYARSPTGTFSAAGTISPTYYYQYEFNVSFSVMGGGSFKKPHLNGTSFGVASSLPIFGSVSSYWLDSGSPWSADAQLSSPNPDPAERWLTQQVTSGSAGSSAAIALTYYHQYLYSFSYSIIDGGTPGAPSINYTSLGSSSSSILKSAPVSQWFDAGTVWAVPPTLTSNTQIKGERWSADVGSGTIAIPGGKVSTSYYHQYAVGTGYSILDGGSPPPPLLNSTEYGSRVTSPLPARTTLLWLDAGSGWTLSSTIKGATAAERWMTENATSGTLAGPISIAPIYFHQYLETPAYSIVDGGSPVAPIFASTSFGVASPIKLGQTLQDVWTDAGTAYSFTNPLGGSTKNERWWTTDASGRASAPGTLNMTYYHQLGFGFAFSVADGGTPAPPTLSYRYAGSAASAVITNSSSGYWLDYGTRWSSPNPLSNSTAVERWQAPVSDGEVLRPANVTLVYYHQFLLNASYAIAKGGSPNPPAFTVTQLDSKSSLTLGMNAQPVWVDGGSNFSLTNPLTSAGRGGERWYAGAAANGSASSPRQTVLVTYTHQYELTVAASPAEGGSVPKLSGWYDSGSVQVISATAQPGWTLWTWMGEGFGSYSGPVHSSTVTLLSPLNETVYFYPGLTISVAGPGSVTVSYGRETAVVSGGAAETFYVPPGSNVTLTANPTSFVYGLVSWGGATSGSDSPTHLVVTKPDTVDSSFGVGVAFVATAWGVLGTSSILGLVTLGVSISLYGLLRKQPRKDDDSPPEVPPK